MRNRLNDLYAKYTGKSIEDIEKATDRDTFLEADEAMAFGIVDKCSKPVRRTRSRTPERGRVACGSECAVRPLGGLVPLPPLANSDQAPLAVFVEFADEGHVVVLSGFALLHCLPVSIGTIQEHGRKPFRSGWSGNSKRDHSDQSFFMDEGPSSR